MGIECKFYIIFKIHNRFREISGNGLCSPLPKDMYSWEILRTLPFCFSLPYFFILYFISMESHHILHPTFPFIIQLKVFPTWIIHWSHARNRMWQLFCKVFPSLNPGSIYITLYFVYILLLFWILRMSSLPCNFKTFKSRNYFLHYFLSIIRSSMMLYNTVSICY